MIREFLAVAALQAWWFQGWMAVVALLAGVVWVLLTWLLAVLVADEWRAWQNRRARARQVTEDALRYVEQRQLHGRIRLLVDGERRRQLEGAARTGRPP